SALTKWLPAVSSRRKDPIRRPESRRIDSHSITRELYGHGRSLAASDCAGGGFPGFHAKNQDSPLVWGHTEHEEHVWRSARHEIWMAEEYSSLEGHSGEHPRSVRHRSDPLRYRGRHCRDGRKRATQRHPSSSGKGRTRGRPGCCRCNLRTTHGVRTRKNRAHPRGFEIPGQRFSCTHRPGWRNRQCSRDFLSGRPGVPTSSCTMKVLVCPCVTSYAAYPAFRLQFQSPRVE